MLGSWNTRLAALPTSSLYVLLFASSGLTKNTFSPCTKILCTAKALSNSDLPCLTPAPMYLTSPHRSPRVSAVSAGHGKLSPISASLHALSVKLSPYTSLLLLGAAALKSTEFFKDFL